MEHYVTYHKILDLCEDFQIQSPILKSFGYGNLVDFGKTTSGTTTMYPFMFMVPQSVTYDENTTTYQFSILFADILNTNLDNEKDVVSDMSLQSRRFLSYIKRGMNANPDLYNFMDITLPVQSIPFQERFNDHTAGIAIQASIVVFEDINACDYYETPTPTPVPTSTPTPTPTSTETPTPTPTITSTTTPTPTDTPSPTPTPSATNPQNWNLGGGFDDNVYSMNKIGSDFYFTGRFNTYDGVLSRGVVKTDSNGIMDTNFIGLKNLVNNQDIYNLLDDGVNGLVLTGSFINYNDNAASDYMVRVDKNTGVPNLFITGTTFNSAAYEAIRLPDNKIIVYGAFTTWANNDYARIIKFNSDWTVDNTYWNASNTFPNGPNRVILNLTGNYAVVGTFTTYQGLTKNRIVEIDATTGLATALFGTGANGNINDITQDSSGNYYIAMSLATGTFNGSSYTSRIIKVDSSGNMIPSATWGSGVGAFSISPTSLFLDEPNGWLYIIGHGTDQPRRVVLSTGIIDQVWTDQQELIVNATQQLYGNSLYVDNNNKVYIGNDFTVFQSAGYNRFIRLNSDGTSNTTLS